MLGGDIAAGLSVAAIAIPAQMATADLAGLPPITGIYAFIAAAIGFAILGGNRFMSCGADSTIAPIIASSLSVYAVSGSPQYAHLAGLLAVLVGVILMATYVGRLGWLASLLSYPVTIGFLGGVSCHIVIGQLPPALGITTASHSLLGELWDLATSIAHIHLYSALVGVGVFSLTAFFAKRAPRFPAALLGLIGSVLMTWWFGLADRGVATLVDIHSSLPPLQLTALPWTLAVELLPSALIIAAVCIMQTAAVAKTVDDTTAPMAKDFGGVGLGSVFAGLWGGFATNTSPARSVITKSSGGASQLAALIAAALLLAVALWAGELMHFVPRAALAGVLVYVGISIFKISEFRRFFIQSRSEFYLAVATSVMIILMPIRIGAMLGVLLSLLHGVYIIARPSMVEFRRIPGSTSWCHISAHIAMEQIEEVGVFHLSAPLYFTNAEFFCTQLADFRAERPALSLVLLECSGVNDLDLTAADKLKELIEAFRHHQVTLAFVRVEAPRTKRMIESTGLLQAAEQKRVFRSVQHAIDHYLPPDKQSIHLRPVPDAQA